jgi:hypothetical protein
MDEPSEAEEWHRESDRIMAAAYRRAVQLDLTPVALALLDAEVGDMISFYPDYQSIWLETSPESYDILAENLDDLDRIFRPVIRGPAERGDLVKVRIRLENVDPDWRKKAAAAIGPGKPLNQGTFASGETYRGLRFASYSEVVIAKELDERDVLYFPLPVGVRLKNRAEPDFLVVHKGKVGVLEVHGAPYHPATRAADDHRRSIFFERAGIFVKVFDAKECRENTKLVVDTFLDLLTGPR